MICLIACLSSGKCDREADPSLSFVSRNSCLSHTSAVRRPVAWIREEHDLLLQLDSSCSDAIPGWRQRRLQKLPGALSWRHVEGESRVEEERRRGKQWRKQEAAPAIITRRIQGMTCLLSHSFIPHSCLLIVELFA